MQSLTQNRSLNRVLLLALIAAIIIIASWLLTSARDLPSRLEEVYSYLANSTSRTNASTDAQIKSLQERLQTDANDWQAYSQLGLAYLQKARETGDPA
jgi:cytochrome c-type biogenesis protein CcmH/NrfG